MGLATGGRGWHFSLRFPPASNGDSTMTDTGSGPRILVVDDDAMILRLLRQIFSRAGFEVEEAGNITDALKLLKTARCALLITDLNMPDGNGVDLIREWRRSGSELPALLLSGSLEEEVREEASRLGRVTCMSKPVDQALLLGTVRELLGDGR